MKFYMASEPRMTRFIIFISIFYIFILLFVNSCNLVGLFMGWEIIGFISFLLIKWWDSRFSALSSSSQALFFNRLGDYFIFLLIIFSLNFSTIFVGFLGIFIIIRFIVKSSIFPFHNWLPSAMEGPTPVSSLLHSSTMVVAGVYILIRFIINMTIFLKFFVLICGVFTFCIGSINAIVSIDLKKIIAYSTISHLGLMVVNFFLISPWFSFFHMIIHSFFKSCSFIISRHSINHYFRDQRIAIFIKNLSPYFSYYWMVSVFILMAFPFISLFIYKEIPFVYFSYFGVNFFFFLIFFVGFLGSLIYSMKLGFLFFKLRILRGRFYSYSKIFDKIFHFTYLIGMFLWVVFLNYLPSFHIGFGIISYVNYLFLFFIWISLFFWIKLSMGFNIFDFFLSKRFFFLRNIMKVGILMESFLSQSLAILFSYIVQVVLNFKVRFYLFLPLVFLLFFFYYL